MVVPPGANGKLRLQHLPPEDKTHLQRKRWAMHLPVVPVAMKQTCTVTKPKKIKLPKAPPPGPAAASKEAVAQTEKILNTLRIVKAKKAESMKKLTLAEPLSEAPRNVLPAIGAIGKPLANYRIPKKRAEPAHLEASSPVFQTRRLSSDSDSQKSPDSPKRPVQLSPQTPSKQPAKFPRTPVKTLPLDRILEDMDKTHGPPVRKRSLDASPERAVHQMQSKGLTKSPSTPSLPYHQASMHTPNHKQFLGPRCFYQEHPTQKRLLCKECKRRYASDSSSDGTCVACRLNKDITNEQAILRTSPSKDRKMGAAVQLPTKPFEKKTRAKETRRSKAKAQKEAKKKEKQRKRRKKVKKGTALPSGNTGAPKALPAISTPAVAQSSSDGPTQSATYGVCEEGATSSNINVSSAKSNSSRNGSVSSQHTLAESHIVPGSGDVCDESKETTPYSEIWSSVKGQEDKTASTLPGTEERTDASDDCGDDADTQGIASDYDSEPEWIVIEDLPCTDTADVSKPSGGASPAPGEQDSDVVVVEKGPVEVIVIDDLSSDEACEQDTPQSPQRNVPFSLSIESGMLSVTLGSEASDLDETLSVIRARTVKEVVCSTESEADDASDDGAPKEKVCGTELEAGNNSDVAAPEDVVLSIKSEADDVSDDVTPTICDQKSDFLQGPSSSASGAPAAGATENAVAHVATGDYMPNTSTEPYPSELLANLYYWPEDNVGTKAADALMQKYVDCIDKVFDLLENCDTEMRSALVSALVPHGFLSLKRIMDLIQAITEKTGCEDTMKASSLGLRIFTLFEGLPKPQPRQDEQSNKATETPTAVLEPAFTTSGTMCDTSADLDSTALSNSEVSKGLDEILQGVFSNSILKSLPLEQLLNDHSPEIPIASPLRPKPEECARGAQPPGKPEAQPCVQTNKAPTKRLHKTVGSQTEETTHACMGKKRNMEKIPKAMVRPRKPSHDPSRPPGSSCAAPQSTSVPWHGGHISVEHSLNRGEPCALSSSVSFQQAYPAHKSASSSTMNCAVPYSVPPTVAYQQATAAQSSTPLSLNSAASSAAFQHAAYAHNSAMSSAAREQAALAQSSRRQYGVGNYDYSHYSQAHTQSQHPVQSYPLPMNNRTLAFNSRAQYDVPYQYSNNPYLQCLEKLSFV
ncbi:uncharacterized protein LOC135370650 isoform X2 [Ornithodoros turicata]|uniref:uncharacterized protein LOC135370650 isoform X2 n=1 Tax=Ornithodoros turicata TaxID=34597 RepID=UPI0031399738